MTNIPSKQSPEERSEFMDEWGKPVLLPIAAGLVAIWIGVSGDIVWLNIAGVVAIMWGLRGVYERVPLLQSGLPLIAIGAVAGFIFYSMEFWIGLVAAIGVAALGGYNLYGRMIDAAGSLVEASVGAAEDKIVAAMNKKKSNSVANKEAEHDK